MSELREIREGAEPVAWEIIDHASESGHSWVTQERPDPESPVIVDDRWTVNALYRHQPTDEGRER